MIGNRSGNFRVWIPIQVKFMLKITNVTIIYKLAFQSFSLNAALYNASRFKETGMSSTCIYYSTHAHTKADS